MAESPVVAVLAASPQAMSGMGAAITAALRELGLAPMVCDPFARQAAWARIRCLPSVLFGKPAYRAARRRATGSGPALLARNEYLRRFWDTQLAAVEPRAIIQVAALCGPPPRHDAPYLVYVDHTGKMSEREGLTWHSDRGDPGAWHALQLRIYGAADYVFVTADNIGESVIGDYGVPAERVFTVGFGSHLLPAGAWHDERPVDVAMVVTDAQRQRLDLFLAAIRTLRSRSGLSVMVIGAPVSDPDVVSLPRQPRAEVHRLLARAKLYVMPAVFGGLQTALEAMAAGCAVVVTDDNGAMHPLTARASAPRVAVPPNPVALAEAISRLLDDPALREQYGRAGQQLVAREFSWEAVVRRMLTHAGIAVPSAVATSAHTPCSDT